jgi:glycosyltransferase involved in cell wall biosynthesis
VSTPFVSLIIPIRNEAPFIERCLAAVCVQDYPAGYIEILITDGMSTDNTRRVIHDFPAIHPDMKIEVMDNSGRIVPTGMNIALRRAKGDVIIRVDGTASLRRIT